MAARANVRAKGTGLLPRAERLTRRRDFSAVYARKRSWANPLLVLYVRRYDSAGTDAETRRFGFSVSRKVGKAHDRNGVKRRLRAICREHGRSWRRGFDAVFVARSASASASYEELHAAVVSLMGKAGLLLREHPSAGATSAAGSVSVPVSADAVTGEETSRA